MRAANPFTQAPKAAATSLPVGGWVLLHSCRGEQAPGCGPPAPGSSLSFAAVRNSEKGWQSTPPPPTPFACIITVSRWQARSAPSPPHAQHDDARTTKALEDATKAAEAACANDPKSPECAAAWDVVGSAAAASVLLLKEQEEGAQP